MAQSDSEGNHLKASLPGGAGCHSLSVAAAFEGRSVLLTGATGYVGSLCVEQLLRTCPTLERVYLLVRVKGDATPEQRVQKLLDTPLFNKLWARPDLLQKVEAVAGEISQPRCGLSDADMARLARVDVVVHSAADIGFDPPITELLRQNYHATAEIMKVAAALPQLRTFVYVSTAYVNGGRPKGSRIEERIYEVKDEAGQPLQHEQFVRRVESMTAEQAAKLVTKLPFPNAYGVSKYLAEALVASKSADGLPTVIVRPTIIGCVAGNPYPGYVGNKSGVTGGAMAMGAGIWTYTRHNPASFMDIVPGDTVSSAILLAAAEMLQDGHKPDLPVRILHVATSGGASPIQSGQWYQLVRAYFSEYPAPHTFSLRKKFPKRMPIVKNRVHAKLLETRSSIKFSLICTLLRVAGYPGHARKLRGAWRAVRTFNHPRLDFDLRFDTSVTAALAARLPEAERAVVRPLWDAAQFAAEAQRLQESPQGRREAAVLRALAAVGGESGTGIGNGSSRGMGTSNGNGSSSTATVLAQKGGVQSSQHPATMAPQPAAATGTLANGEAGSGGTAQARAAAEAAEAGAGPAAAEAAAAAASADAMAAAAGEVVARDHLPADHAAAAKEGWRRYMRSYLAGIAALCLRQAPAELPMDTDFVYIEPRHAGPQERPQFTRQLSRWESAKRAADDIPSAL